MENKKARKQTIQDLIKSRKISSQETLLKLLEERGYTVTQATLSRDLKKMGVVKVSEEKGPQYYTLLTGESYSQSTLLQDIERGFVSLEFSHHMGVMKTLPGHAASLAFALDNLAIPELLATIAGDDTVLLIPGDTVNRQELTEALITMIPIIKEEN